MKEITWLTSYIFTLHQICTLLVIVLKVVKCMYNFFKGSKMSSAPRASINPNRILPVAIVEKVIENLSFRMNYLQRSRRHLNGIMYP